jgi:hypothetical protein
MEYHTVAVNTNFYSGIRPSVWDVAEIVTLKEATTASFRNNRSIINISVSLNDALSTLEFVYIPNFSFPY